MEQLPMLTQAEADALMATMKYVEDSPPLLFPVAGTSAMFHLKSEDGKQAFHVDVNRKGQIRVSKCTYQERYANVEILLRLDINGPSHENPDGEVVPCPHLHVYRENFGDKWAFPMPRKFTNPNDLVRTLVEFLKFCRVVEVPEIQRSL